MLYFSPKNAIAFFGLIFIALTTIFLIAKTQAIAATSVNIPVGSYIYRELERLEVKGLIKGSMLSTKPLTRLEAVRLLAEAEENWDAYPERAPDAGIIILRLRQEFKDELEKTSVIKPVDSINTKFLYSEDGPYFTNTNNNGDAFREGFNFRVNLGLSAGLADTLSLYLSPEYRLDEDNSYGELIYGYMTLDVIGLRLEIGRDSMWWGAGYHGNLLMTNNAKPFDMVKLTSQNPFVLPWFFKYLGLFKPTIFLARLEEDRDFSRPYLGGIRLDLKPHPVIEIGLSRVAMFGGGDRKVDLVTVWDVFTARSENTPDEPGNQIASGDIKIIIPWSIQPMVLYAEIGGEDEAGTMPSHIAYVTGFYLPGLLSADNLEIRAEYANNYVKDHPRVWYTHHLYKNGYTYKGKVIGHHMGTDARDLFMRMQYHFSSGSMIGIEADQEWSGVHSAKETKKQWIGADFEYLFTEAITFSGGVGIEDTDDTNDSQKATNTVSWLKMDWLF